MSDENNIVEAAMPALTGTMGVLSPQQVQAQMGAVQSILKKVLTEGTHYGKIPGTNAKSLFQAGADKLMLAFQLRAEYDVVDKTVERLDVGGFISFTVRCRLYHRPTGIFVAESLGNCNSRERKYLTRTVYPNKASAEELEIGRREWREGQSGPYEVIVLAVDPFEILHTLLTMGKKRAKVGSVREALAASDALEIDSDQADYLRGVANEAENRGTDGSPRTNDLAAAASKAQKLGDAAAMAKKWTKNCGDNDGFCAMVGDLNEGDINPQHLSSDQLDKLMAKMAEGLENA